MAEITGVERRLSFSHRPSTKPPDYCSHTRVDDEGAVDRKYAIGDVLGQGSFGIVREVTSRATGERLAVKIVNKDKPGSSSILMLAREVEVLKRLEHPHIIKLEEIMETSQKMYLVMELCTGGELTARLKLRGYFKEQEAKEVMRQLTEVVVYLHDNDIVHRDLKLENVLLKSPIDSTNDKIDIKVTDFGLAHMRTLSDLEDPIMDQRCGTPYYMAPEVIQSRHEYTKMCDVWSLGVIMYYILCGKVPFQSDAAMKLEDSIVKGVISFREVEWTSVSSKAISLIKGMLCRDTTQRLTALRVLKDAWFTGQSSNVQNAIDLMRDMTDDGRTEALLIPPRIPTLEPVPERHGITTTSPTHRSRQQNRSHSVSKPVHHHHSQQPRTLTEKRSRSSTALTTSPSPSPCQLKYASTSSLSASRSPNQRSNSVTTRPTSSMQPARRTTPVHGGISENQRTSAVTAHSKPCKHNAHSSTKI